MRSARTAWTQRGVRVRVAAAAATESVVVHPAKEISGVVNLPGSKSLSNRVLLLAALSRGCVTEVNNLLESDDISYMVDALKTLGVDVDWDKEGRKGKRHEYSCISRY